MQNIEFHSHESLLFYSNCCLGDVNSRLELNVSNIPKLGDLREKNFKDSVIQPKGFFVQPAKTGMLPGNSQLQCVFH